MDTPPEFIDAIEHNTDTGWHPHPSFPGVSMKTLIHGATTAGALSQHLVRVAPGCALLLHTHPSQCELHLVIAGDAIATLENQERDYRPGHMTTIPVGARHSVLAGREGVTLLASFSPAQG